MLSPVTRLRWIVVLVLAACSGKPATSSSTTKPGPTTSGDAGEVAATGFAVREPFARPGEVMSYRISIHEVEVAAFSIAVGQPTELAGRPVIVVQSGVQDAGLGSWFTKVSDNFTAWIDAKTTAPVLFRADELASKSDKTVERSDAEVSALVDGAFPVRVTRPDTGETVESQVVGDNPLYDLNGFLIVLRTWEAAPGTSLAADIIRSRYLWRTQVTMVGYESVVTELGELGALRIDGSSRRVQRDGTDDKSSDTRRYSLWISDDADRVPVKMVAHTDYGDLQMDIVAYQPPS